MYVVLVLYQIYTEIWRFVYRRQTNGRCSGGNFLRMTRSVIRQGLYNCSPPQHRILGEELPAAVMDEDKMLKLDDVKTSLFTRLDTLEKE